MSCSIQPVNKTNNLLKYKKISFYLLYMTMYYKYIMSHHLQIYNNFFIMCDNLIIIYIPGYAVIFFKNNLCWKY